MSTAVIQRNYRDTSRTTPAADRHGWGVALLLAVVATLFMRPADLIPALADWPIYQWLIAGCLLVSARPTLAQLSQQGLIRQPVTACLLILVVSVGLSHLVHGQFWEARQSSLEVGKAFALYLLIAGLINTPARLLRFVQGLSLAITVVAALTLLDRYEMFTLSALTSVQDSDAAADGSRLVLERLRGTGIFHDPNDFGMILVLGLILTSSCFMKPNTGWTRHVWLIPIYILMGSLALTHSRGALLSLACAIPSAVAYRRGWKFGLAAMVGMPLLAIAFSARMSDVNAISEGTGQSRIQIWSDSLVLWREHPVFGLGAGMLVEELEVVSHNSFLHCYAELGMLGGTAFLASFIAAILGLWTIRNENWKEDRTGKTAQELHELAHLRMFIFAAVAAYVAGIMTISRQFVPPTYLILGLSAATQTVSVYDGPRWRFGNTFLLVSLLASVGILLFFHSVVRLLVNW